VGKLSKEKINLVFVIGGEEILVETNMHSPLHVCRDEALRAGQHTGRGGDDWEIKDANGNILDPNQKVAELSLQDGAKLYLNQKVSGGGN
jgi:hypothetical protein